MATVTFSTFVSSGLKSASLLDAINDLASVRDEADKYGMDVKASFVGASESIDLDLTHTNLTRITDCVYALQGKGLRPVWLALDNEAQWAYAKNESIYIGVGLEMICA